MANESTPSTKSKVDMSNVPAEYLSESGRYKPGHDARHVSNLLSSLRADAQANSRDGKIKVTAIREAAKALPTEALKAKMQKAADRYNASVDSAKEKAAVKAAAKTEADKAKAEAKAAKAAEKAAAKEAAQAINEADEVADDFPADDGDQF